MALRIWGGDAGRDSHGHCTPCSLGWIHPTGIPHSNWQAPSLLPPPRLVHRSPPEQGWWPVISQEGHPDPAPQVENQRIQYRQDGPWAQADRFTLLANASEMDRQSQPRTLFITILPRSSKRPRLRINTGLRVRVGCHPRGTWVLSTRTPERWPAQLGDPRGPTPSLVTHLRESGHSRAGVQTRGGRWPPEKGRRFPGAARLCRKAETGLSPPPPHRVPPRRRCGNRPRDVSIAPRQRPVPLSHPGLGGAGLPRRRAADCWGGRGSSPPLFRGWAACSPLPQDNPWQRKRAALPKFHRHRLERPNYLGSLRTSPYAHHSKARSQSLTSCWKLHLLFQTPPCPLQDH